MRFRIGAIPHNDQFSPCEPWIALREPTPIAMQIIAFPLGLVAFVVVGWLWIAFTNVSRAPDDSPALVITSLLLIIPVHELIHAAVHPGMGRTDHSILGAWPKAMVFYAHYDGELSRDRLLCIFMMPFLVISIVPWLVCVVLGVAPKWVALVSLVNAFAAYGDLFGVCLLLWQVPRQAQVRNQGWNTYWRANHCDTPPVAS